MVGWLNYKKMGKTDKNKILNLLFNQDNCENEEEKHEN